MEQTTISIDCTLPLKLFVVILFMLHVGLTAEPSSYECYPNGTIVMVNPNASRYRYNVVFDNDHLLGNNYTMPEVMCTTSWSLGYVTLTINESPGGYCTRDRDLLVILSTRLIDKYFTRGGRDTIWHIIKCAQIPEAGINIQVHQEFEPRPEEFDGTEWRQMAPMMPTFDLSVRSVMRPCCDPTVTTEVTDTVIGTALKWTLEVYKDYYLFPILCQAHGSRDDDGPTVDLYINGCNQSSDLVEYSGVQVFGDRRIYASDFQVFQFYASPILRIVCELLICPEAGADDCFWDGSTGCGINEVTPRKRRETRLQNEEDLIIRTVTALRVFTKLTNSGPAMNTGQVSTKLPLVCLAITSLLVK